jgi:hypothetical protein
LHGERGDEHDKKENDERQAALQGAKPNPHFSLAQRKYTRRRSYFPESSWAHYSRSSLSLPLLAAPAAVSTRERNFIFFEMSGLKIFRKEEAKQINNRQCHEHPSRRSR